MLSRIKAKPPLYLTSALMQATRIEITVISYIPVAPCPMDVNIWETFIAPVAIPTITEKAMPPISTMNTFRPIRAVTKTKMYGITWKIL